MADEKDRFGETMRLVERAKEDIYFAARDRELIEKLKARMEKVEHKGDTNQQRNCPKCSGKLETYKFMDFILDQCPSCGGVWLDKGELEGILHEVARGPLASLIRRFVGEKESGE